MKVSNKADYAIHAMVYVSAKTNSQFSTINDIAEKAKVPREYLAKILKELVSAGFLKSWRGVHGGYKLGKPASKISFLNIIEAMDGPLQVISCADDRHARKGHPLRKFCVGQVFWIPLQDKLKHTLGEMTLDKLGDFE